MHHTKISIEQHRYAGDEARELQLKGNTSLALVVAAMAGLAIFLFLIIRETAEMFIKKVLPVSGSPFNHVAKEANP